MRRQDGEDSDGQATGYRAQRTGAAFQSGGVPTLFNVTAPAGKQVHRRAGHAGELLEGVFDSSIARTGR